jgi:hypothetical protein
MKLINGENIRCLHFSTHVVMKEQKQAINYVNEILIMHIYS